MVIAMNGIGIVKDVMNIFGFVQVVWEQWIIKRIHGFSILTGKYQVLDTSNEKIQNVFFGNRDSYANHSMGSNASDSTFTVFPV